MTFALPPAQRVPVNTLEDWRGVDISQIRRQLGMTPAERLRHMTHVANVLIRMRSSARNGS